MIGQWGYNARKAAQAAAYYALKAGGEINVLKLVKILYLTEREFMIRYDDPMFYDRFVSMDHGPVPSITLNLINGLNESEDWSEFLSGRSGHDIGVANDNISVDSLDELSRADIDVLADLWEKFSGFNRYQLRDYTHKYCPEWEDPHGSSTPIPHERVFKFLDKEDSAELSNDIEKHRHLANNLAAA